MRNVFIVVASLALLLGACGREPLVVATADLEPKVRVVSTAGVGTEVTLVLFRDLVATYDLLPGERITAAPDGGTAVVMTPGVDDSAWLRRRAYVATLPEVGPRQDVVITFERPQDGEVLEIVARVPGEIAVTRPAAGEERTLNEPFAVAWDPLPGDQVEFRFDVAGCEGLEAERLADLRTEAGFAALPSPTARWAWRTSPSRHRTTPRAAPPTCSSGARGTVGTSWSTRPSANSAASRAPCASAACCRCRSCPTRYCRRSTSPRRCGSCPSPGSAPR